MFKGGVDGCTGCGGWDLSGFAGGCAGYAGLSSAFLINFVLHLNDLPTEVLSSTSSISSP